MDEEIFGEGWKHLSKSKILLKGKTTYRLVRDSSAVQRHFFFARAVGPDPALAKK